MDIEDVLNDMLIRSMLMQRDFFKSKDPYNELRCFRCRKKISDNEHFCIKKIGFLKVQPLCDGCFKL